MKQNIFKSAQEPREEKPEFRRQRYHRNEEDRVRDERFDKLYGRKYTLNKEEEKVVVTVNIEEMYFPELGTGSNIGTTISKMNYKEASQKEVVDTDQYKIEDGWCVIYKDNNNEIIRENGSKPRSAFIRERRENPSTNFSNVAKHLIYNWKKYKDNYIELYGEDEYARNYSIDNSYVVDENYVDVSEEECDVYSDYSSYESEY